MRASPTGTGSRPQTSGAGPSRALCSRLTSSRSQSASASQTTLQPCPSPSPLSMPLRSTCGWETPSAQTFSCTSRASRRSARLGTSSTHSQSTTGLPSLRQTSYPPTSPPASPSAWTLPTPPPTCLRRAPPPASAVAPSRQLSCLPAPPHTPSPILSIPLSSFPSSPPPSALSTVATPSRSPSTTSLGPRPARAREGPTSPTPFHGGVLRSGSTLMETASTQPRWSLRSWRRSAPQLPLRQTQGAS
mmetsp:Transcript_6485/g.15935  ORF Transcript_6485/g.15935 Transcript_6485/m.15935 type:complete len:246 (-) Transcript_6485:169-906(-)